MDPSVLGGYQRSGPDFVLVRRSRGAISEDALGLRTLEGTEQFWHSWGFCRMAIEFCAFNRGHDAAHMHNDPKPPGFWT